MTVVIKDTYVVVGDQSNEQLSPVDLVISGDRIAAIGKGLAAGYEGGKDVEIIDGRALIAMPGLVNAHIHSVEGFQQGVYRNAPLEPWLLEAHSPFASRVLNPREEYLQAALVGIEAIRGGCTTLQDDFVHLAATADAQDHSIQAFFDIGVRIWSAVDMWDVPFVETLPYVQETFPADLYQKLLELPVTPAEHWVALFEQHHAKWHGRDDLVRVHLAPCGPQRCSPDLWRAVDALSSRYRVPVHSHCLETKVQAAEAQDKHGKSWIRYLADLGVLSDRLSLVHTIWIDENDIALMAEHGVTSIHNPLSNLKTGAGIAPVRALLEAGISVALGSDGICTADGIDMIEVIKVANLMHTLRSDEYESWISPLELLRMATIGGARSGLMADEIGTLEPGKKADIILLDRDAWGFIPLADPINSLTYSVSSEVVRHSIINGRIVMRDRKIVSVDEDEIKLEVRESAERFLREDVPRMRESASSYTPYMRALYRKAYDQAVPVLGMPRLHERSR